MITIVVQKQTAQQVDAERAARVALRLQQEDAMLADVFAAGRCVPLRDLERAAARHAFAPCELAELMCRRGILTVQDGSSVTVELRGSP